MAPKRKMEIVVSGESERTLFSSFQNAANNLCQLYAQAAANEKEAFDAGQRHSYVKMHEWIAAKLGEGRLLTVSDILVHLQDKMNEPMMGHTEQWGCGTDENGASTSQAEQNGASAQQSMSHSDTHMQMNSDVTMD